MLISADLSLQVVGLDVLACRCLTKRTDSMSLRLLETWIFEYVDHELMQLRKVPVRARTMSHPRRCSWTKKSPVVVIRDPFTE